MHHQKIIIIDFGSQYTQLIARKIRELNVYCEIYPYNKIPPYDENTKGIILSGSPYSVHQEGAPNPHLNYQYQTLPLLGICYGAQWLAHVNGGKVERSMHREYGKSKLIIQKKDHPLFAGIPEESTVWMSHGDSITELPSNTNVIAKTENIPVAAYEFQNQKVFGIQFHPEVYHSEYGINILKNFVYEICGAKGDWTPAHFIEESIENIRSVVQNEEVVLALSGGVDSSVAAFLIHKAIGKRLHPIFVNNGLLRKNEFKNVLDAYRQMGLEVHGVDAAKEFLEALKGISDPEQKRKIIGKKFIDVFERESKKFSNVRWLAQGTIYPDVIESLSVKGPSATIKSHHNVGGLPEKMNLKVLEPLKFLFKDEVRKIGKELGLPDIILQRHPFPGPGLAIRIIGEITEEKLRLIQEADDLYIHHLKQSGHYQKIWQAGTILLDTKSVGVMGDERTYEYVVALRAVTSTDGMTADWYPMPYDLLGKISNDIINKVKGINRVVYDISSKPPATIEWE
ncbi:MAG: glutamine-hydrolyzing GMP synthase [Bacteroidia bacterium]|nr:glutamine-hydrolyzing GMP synthase [Bacteroidia bacterium]